MKILWIDNVCVCVCVLIEVNVERCATCGLTVQIRIEHGVSTCAQMDETVVNTGITFDYSRIWGLFATKAAWKYRLSNYR